MALIDRPVVSSLLFNEAGTAVEVRGNGSILCTPNNAWPGNTSALREAYFTTTSTAMTQARSSTWNDPGNGGQRSLKSSSNNDGAGTNTGLRTVRVTYYRNDGTGPFVEDVTLNGTTAVAMTETDLRFVEHMEGLTVGSNAVAIGNVDLFANNNGTGTVLGRVTAGEARTYWAHHWVPPDTTMYLTSMHAGIISTGILGSGSNGRLLGRFQPLLTANSVNQDVVFGMRVARDLQSFDMPLGVPARIIGPGLFVVWARADGAGSSQWFTGFTFYDE